VRALLLFLILAFTGQAEAYLAYSPNANIEEEVEANPYRILPHSEHFYAALDADFFKPVFVGAGDPNYYKYDFYHGNGFWMDLRTEYKPNQDLVVNLKLDITHGTSSNGPTYLAFIIPRAAITYRFKLLGFDWESRLSDINRQTIGDGLFIEDKDTEGGYIIGKRDQLTAKIMVDGTSSYKLEGGVIAGDLNLWDGVLGATGFINETDVGFTPSQFMGTLYSRKSWKNGLGVGVEYGGDTVAIAGLAYVKYETDFDRLHLMFKPQFRHYGRGVLGSLPGQVQQNYISYDQNDKPFTTLMDIFPYGDNVETYSAQLNAEYAVNVFYHLYAETEYADFQFHDRDPVKNFFFRTGVKFYPFKERVDEFGFLIGNKFLNASTTQGDPTVSTARTYSAPDTPDFENKPLFYRQLYWMINFSTHL
jgi:hypothetical protein